MVNNGAFRVVDPGPLHAPVEAFTIRRDEKLRLVVETEASAGAKSTAARHPAGRVTFATERARLVNVAGMEAEIEGLTGSSATTMHASGRRGVLRETIKVHRLTVRAGEAAAAAYTIDWLENLRRSPFNWPGSYETKRQTTVTRFFGQSEDGIARSDVSESSSFSNTAARILVGGRTIYVCALDERMADGTIHPGCVVYEGAPDDEFRKRVRVALSFALGIHVVDLGTTLYDESWSILVAIAQDAYSIGMRAFDLQPQPLAPVGGDAQYRYHLTAAGLDRAVNAFVEAYDDLDLGNLSWAYWHACTATTHIAPVHFGAAIEALQRRYVSKHGGGAKTIIPAGRWKPLHDKLAALIAEAVDVEEGGEILADKLKWLNRRDQRPRLKALLDDLGLPLSPEEDDAWKRRNEAAHGMPIPEGQTLSAIRDTRLLRGLFHRMLLRMTGAAETYVDYATEGFPPETMSVPPAEMINAESWLRWDCNLRICNRCRARS